MNPTTPREPLQIRLTLPRGGHLGVREVFAAYLGLPDVRLSDFGVLPQQNKGQKLLALRYIIANGDIWMRHFVWKGPLKTSLQVHYRSTGLSGDALETKVTAIEASLEDLIKQIAHLRKTIVNEPPRDSSWIQGFLDFKGSLEDAGFLKALIVLDQFPEVRRAASLQLKERSVGLYKTAPEILDLLYLATFDLTTYPATTTSAAKLKYVIIADKGEMGVRAVRETLALKLIPVTVFSLQDDARSLQVRLTESSGGITVGLRGGFRESYGNYQQIAENVITTFRERFQKNADAELSLAALYPGYGPLAENAAAIRYFRRQGIVFMGPMQDVVENAGDKRKFRLIAQELNPEAVTPGIVIDSNDPHEIKSMVEQGYHQKQFTFPGRLKAANGGGGRGQAVVLSLDALAPAIQKVLGEIQSNGWDAGVMFEQNISETIHLEVQIMRDRYGNARHFGMRDCSEQRASQKIQEEAPPAILVNNPTLQKQIESIAVGIANKVGYVGAGTIELMFKGGKFYFLEMNTRIQVEHPVTEESHCIVREKNKTEPLNLVQWQMQLAQGKPLDFEQHQIQNTHVAREYRINAESWKPNLKDSRDGKMGLFLPNAGIFETILLPSPQKILKSLQKKIPGLEDLKIRFDSGFEEGDVLVNKDPTFGKLIVAVRTRSSENKYEALRLASLEVLEQLFIGGRQVMPNGKVIEKSEFMTNVSDHIRILKADVLTRHCQGNDEGRHVNWVVNSLRQ